jgi:acyl-CoA synthetase (AMP-forming)/AMP-acid ligase II
MNANIINILFDNSGKWPQKPAIIHGGKSISYEQLCFRVQAFAACLRKRGIRRGDRVLVFVSMSIDLYAVMLAILHCGASAVFIDAWAGRRRIEKAMRTVSCRGFVFCGRGAILGMLCKEVRNIPVRTGIRQLKRFVPKQKAFMPAENVLESDTALVTFTTGSTGSPKAANRTHGFLLAQNMAVRNHLLQTPDQVTMVTLPVFVMNNLAVGNISVLPCINFARPHIYRPERVIRDISRYSVYSAIGSPVFFLKLADYCLRRKISVNINAMHLGGAPVFPVHAQKLLKAFPECFVGIVYGSTEAEPISMISAKELAAFNTASKCSGLPVGRPIADIRVIILKIIEGPVIAKDDVEIGKLTEPPFVIGEICVCGPHVLREYLNCPEAQAQNKIQVGKTVWHRTGDAGYLDNDGGLFLMERVKSRIISGNTVIYPFIAEQALSAIKGCNAGTIINDRGRIVAVVEKKTGVHLSRADILDSMAKSGICGIEDVKFMRIPRDPRHHGKIDFDKLNSGF